VAYRRTVRVEERLASTRERILSSAVELVAKGGFRAASIAAVAERAGVATGSVYRHFDSKAELFAEVFRRASQRELDVVRAVGSSPGTASERLGRGLETFARRALRGRRLAYALLAEPADPAVDEERLRFRRAYRDAFAMVLRQGIEAGEFPPLDVEVAAPALVGAMGEALVGPLSPRGRAREAEDLVASIVGFCMRALSREERYAHA